MLTGKIFRDAIISAAVNIENNKRQIDELNVYPVPDGDTGTNMSMTMKAAKSELELLKDDLPLCEIADITASALLRGARGNSGVILSLLFRGLAKGFSGIDIAETENIANAMELGVNSAYKAVMKPTEGTILTVAKEAAIKAQVISAEIKDLSMFWSEICKETKKSLDNTPELLPILKKSGVVDAGGMGLLVIYEAMLKIFNGEALENYKSNKVEKTIVDAVEINTEEIKFTYCTEFLITKNKKNMDFLKLRAYFETIGDSVIVVDDDDIIKVHLHTNNPGKALERALNYGYVNLPKIENMKVQHEGKVKEIKLNKNQDTPSVYPENNYGFVAVAAGKGLEEMFKDLGVDLVVSGGQTMNPSTDDILKAIQQTPAKNIFVLPNNKNIIMSAEQAIKLSDRNVCVLQTRTIPQGISAMLAFNDSVDFSENKIEMTKAFEKVSTGLITFAARDLEYEGKKIKKGELIALDNGKLAFSDSDLSKITYRLVKKLVKHDTSFITLIYGSDVTEDNAEKLKDFLNQKFNNKIEIMLINGGQPVYYYIISVE